MNKHRTAAFLSLAITMSILLYAHSILAQQSGPAETKGLTIVKTAASDLGPEIEGMQGRRLRMRVLVLDPGGTIAVHRQTDRPEVIYILQGSITEYQNGNVIQRNAGDTWTAGKEITHGIANPGTGPATIVVTDVFKAQ